MLLLFLDISLTNSGQNLASLFALKRKLLKKNTLILILSLAISTISFSFVNIKSLRHSNKDAATPAVAAAPIINSNTAEVDSVTSIIYDSLNLEQKGLSKNTLELAVKGFLRLQQEGMLNNSLLSIVDLSQSSREKRFYLLDMKNTKLLENTYVAHGKNSGFDMAQEFSNAVGSEKSSLGFYVTGETYKGKHGFSLKIEGVEAGFNDNAAERSIVVHGADYVNAQRAQSNYMGRSQGCPALPFANYKKIINEIKDGSALFIYYPDQEYLNKSAVVNDQVISAYTVG